MDIDHNDDIYNHSEFESKDEEMVSFQEAIIDVSLLLNVIKNGISPRYDLVSLDNNYIINYGKDHNNVTSFRRSSQIQRLFKMSYTGYQSNCVVKTSDDIYHLNQNDLFEIEENISEWVNKHGEYSLNIHPSISKINDSDYSSKLKTTCYIFKYEIIGRFVGDEMIESEFYDIYSGCFDEKERLLYSWIIPISEPCTDLLNNNNSSCSIYDRRSSSLNLIRQYDMLIDCLGTKNNKLISFLSLICDCRHDISKYEMTINDLNRENILFITCKINGWYAKFAVAKRNINKNEILYGDYGDGWHELKKQFKRQKNSINQYVESIEKILKK